MFNRGVRPPILKKNGQVPESRSVHWRAYRQACREMPAPWISEVPLDKAIGRLLQWEQTDGALSSARDTL